MTLEKSHLLICRTDNIGDVVLTLPLAGFLKQRHPGIKISFLCRSYAAPMVRCCTAIDNVMEIEQLHDAATEFKKSRIDAVIFARPHKYLAAAAQKAGIPHRVGTSHRWFHWLYCNRLAHFSRARSRLHEAQLNFKLLRPLGIDFVPDLQEIPSLYRLVAPGYRDRMGMQPSQFNIIVHPKSNGNGREWPIAHYMELARLLLQHDDIRIWITGSEGEGQWIENHAPDFLQMQNVRNTCGQFSLGDLTSFINAADGLIASGTGPLHLAAALGKRALGLFPPLRPIDPGRWGTLGAKSQTLCKASGCTHCKDPANCICMKSITPTEVAQIILHWKQQAPD